MEDYRDFAIDTAKRVATEECRRFYDDEFEIDVRTLMQTWGDRLSGRIAKRMEDLGIRQNLFIQVSWTPDDPKFDFVGATETGVVSEQADSGSLQQPDERHRKGDDGEV